MGNIDIIANLVFPYFLDFLLYFECKLIVDMKLELHLRVTDFIGPVPF